MAKVGIKCDYGHGGRVLERQAHDDVLCLEARCSALMALLIESVRKWNLL